MGLGETQIDNTGLKQFRGTVIRGPCFIEKKRGQKKKVDKRCREKRMEKKYT